MHMQESCHLVALDKPLSQRIPLFIVRLSILNTVTPSMVSWVPKQKPSWYLCLDQPYFFLFFSFVFSKLEHLIFKFGLHHHHDHHLAPPLGMGPSFHVYTLSTRISPKVSSIIQNQTSAFNLFLFGNWWQHFHKDIQCNPFGFMLLAQDFYHV